MKKITAILFFSVLIAALLGAESVWTGNAAVGNSDNFPGNSDIFQATSNAFPAGTQLRVTNPRNGSSVDATVVGRVRSPGIFLLVDEKTAQAINLPRDHVIPIRVTPVGKVELTPFRGNVEDEGNLGESERDFYARNSDDIDYNPLLTLNESGYEEPAPAAPVSPREKNIPADTPAKPTARSSFLAEESNASSSDSSSLDFNPTESTSSDSSSLDFNPTESTSSDSRSLDFNPTESTSSDSRSLDFNPTESTSSDSRSLDFNPTESTSSDSRSLDFNPTESTSSDSRSLDFNPTESTSSDSRSLDFNPTESTSSDSSSLDFNPVESSSSDSRSLDFNPTESSSVDSSSVEYSPVESSSTESNSVDSSSVETNSVEKNEVYQDNRRFYFLSPSDRRPPSFPDSLESEVPEVPTPPSEEPPVVEKKKIVKEPETVKKPETLPSEPLPAPPVVVPAVELREAAPVAPAAPAAPVGNARNQLVLMNPNENGALYIQIAAFKKRGALENEAERFKLSAGEYPLRVAVKDTGRGIIYRLLVGPLRPAETGVVLKTVRSVGFPDAFPFIP